MKRPISIFNYSIKNASKDSVDIYIDGEIVDASTQEVYKSWMGDTTSVSFKSFRNEINNQPAKVYNVYINSGGGLVTDAMAMHDFLKDLQNQGKTVNTIGQGIVASAATYILMADKNSRMSENSWFMIHNVSGGIWGNVDDIESYATTLRKFNDRSRDFYAEYTSMRKEDITKLMNAETWMTAEEAKGKNFIKEVTGGIAFTNKISPESWDFKDTEVLAAYNSHVGALPTQEGKLITEYKNILTDMKVTFNSLKDVFKNVKPTNAEAATIVSAIADALSPAFDAQAEQMEKDLNEEIKNSKEGLVKDITAAVEKNFEQRIKDLEEKNTQLELDLEKKIGNASSEEKPEGKGIKMKGSFAKAVGAL